MRNYLKKKWHAKILQDMPFTEREFSLQFSGSMSGPFFRVHLIVRFQRFFFFFGIPSPLFFFSRESSSTFTCVIKCSPRGFNERKKNVPTNFYLHVKLILKNCISIKNWLKLIMCVCFKRVIINFSNFLIKSTGVCIKEFAPPLLFLIFIPFSLSPLSF